jgi:hypothetical protein
MMVFLAPCRRESEFETVDRALRLRAFTICWWAQYASLEPDRQVANGIIRSLCLGRPFDRLRAGAEQADGRLL